MFEFKPGYAVAPCTILRDHINFAYDGSERSFAATIDMPNKYVRELLEGRIHITDFIAEKLSKTGLSKQYFLNLQKNYDDTIEMLINAELAD